MSKIISREQVQSCAAWDVPGVSEQLDNNGAQSGATDLHLLPPKQLEKIQKQAYEAGFQRGVLEGIKNGQQKINERAQKLDHVLSGLAQSLAEFDIDVESQLVALCTALLKQLVRREIKAEPGQVVAIVKESLSLLPIVSSNIRIRLHPEDAKIVQSVLFSSEENRDWHIVEDPVIQRGGCKVITDSSFIDATIETQIAQLIKQVFGGLRESDQESR